MSILRDLAYQIGFDVDSLGIDIADKRVDELDDSLKKTDTSATKLNTTFKGFGVGGLLTGLGATFLLREAIDQTLNFANAAGEAIEQANLFQVSFRDLSDETEAWARMTAQDLGRSEFAFLDMLGTVQNQFVGFTDGSDEARSRTAEFSKFITTFVVDLNSLQNTFIDDADAMQQFTSGLVGNHEALRRFGVVLTENNLDLRAQQLGIKGSFAELDPFAKVLVRTAEAVSQSTDAIGDASATSDEYTALIRGLRGQFSDMRIELGMELIPVFSDLINEVLDNKDAVRELLEGFITLGVSATQFLIPVVSWLGENFDDVTTFGKTLFEILISFKALSAVNTVLATMNSVSALLGPTLVTAGAGAEVAGLGFTAMLGPVGLVAGAVIGLIALFATLEERFDFLTNWGENIQQGFEDTGYEQFITGASSQANPQYSLAAATGGTTNNRSSYVNAPVQIEVNGANRSPEDIAEQVGNAVNSHFTTLLALTGGR